MICVTHTPVCLNEEDRGRERPAFQSGIEGVGSGGLQQCSGTEEGGAGLRDGTFGGRAGTGSR